MTQDKTKSGDTRGDSTPEDISELKDQIRNLKKQVAELQSQRHITDKSEVFLDSVVENIPAMIFIKDEKELRFQLLNRFGEELLGYSKEELLGKNDYDFFPKEQADFFTSKDREVLEGGKLVVISEEPIQTKDGERILRTKKIPLPVGENGDRYLVGISEDITEIKRVESELKASQEKEMLRTQKLESLGLLAGGIAHDFNNLLTAILGNLSLVQLELMERDDQESRELINTAESACHRARGLTDQLLGFLKGTKAEKKALPISKIIREAEALSLGGTAIQFELRDSTQGGAVEIDEGQMVQVFNNLFINARQAMPRGGQVSVTCSLETVRANGLPPYIQGEFSQGKISPGEYVRIEVADSGRGIPKSILNKVFDPYFTTKTDGSGLGLAAVYSIVIQHGGYISVTSDYGKGTVIHVLLPLAATMDSPRVQPAPFVAHRGKGEVLIMDDDDSILTSSTRMIKALGYNITTAVKGEDALEFYQDRMKRGAKFDIAILDLTIKGGMGGKDLAQKILAIDPEACLVVSSGYSADKVLANHLSFGFRDVLVKPYTLRDMATVLNRVMRSPGVSTEKLSAKKSTETKPEERAPLLRAIGC